MSRCRVCVADDTVDVASNLSDGLKLLNYDAVPVYTGTEALEVCADGDVDLILLDVCLPDIDGHEVCRRLKKDPKTHDIVVIFVTVRGSARDVVKGFQLGAVDYITKPYNLPMVMVRVEAALKKRQFDGTSENISGGVLDDSYTDVLTGLRNRRYLLDRLQEEVERAHRYNYPVSCVMFDLDEVDAQDDELGPVSIDDLLAEIGMTLRNHSRTFDVVARYDGTLFAAILPHSPLGDATGYAKKILQEIDTTTFAVPNFPTEANLSAGIVTCRNGSAVGADFVLGEAMRGLLQAKSKSGGERLVARNLSEV